MNFDDLHGEIPSDINKLSQLQILAFASYVQHHVSPGQCVLVLVTQHISCVQYISRVGPNTHARAHTQKRNGGVNAGFYLRPDLPP
jgi:hypothetical protein